MIQVKLYTREGCHLCERTLADLKELNAIFPHEVTLVDIDSDQRLFQEYSLKIPVVEVGAYRLQAPITRQDLEESLTAAYDAELRRPTVEQSILAQPTYRKKNWTKSDSFSYWIACHWLSVFNILILIYVGLPFVAPVLMKVGLEAPAKLIYRGYSFTCHQLAFRSFFLFGEQWIYPRAEAGLNGEISYSQATGMGENTGNSADILAARSFVGNPAMGYKVALCERDVAIYGGILIFGLLYGLTKRRIRQLPWYLWILIGILPITLDGGSQLIGQLLGQSSSFASFSRESTPFLRVLTGFLFGFTSAWFGYPLVEQTMAESRQILEAKRRI